MVNEKTMETEPNPVLVRTLSETCCVGKKLSEALKLSALWRSAKVLVSHHCVLGSIVCGVSVCV